MKDSKQNLGSTPITSKPTSRNVSLSRFTQKKPELSQRTPTTTMKVMEKPKVNLWKRIMFGESATARDFDPFDKKEEKKDFKKDKVYANTTSDKGSSVLQQEIGEIKNGPKDMSYLDYIDEKNKILENIDLTLKPDGKIPYTPLFCTPNCQHNHTHSYQNDFFKSTVDARTERPGICFLEGLKTAPGV
jgi:hypothetical protein